VSASIERPSSAEDLAALPGGLSSAQEETRTESTLASLPVGARLILRCRKDWRDATVAARSPEHVTLSVGSPSGHTYRVKRPPDTLLIYEGPIPILGEGHWRAGLVRYDVRW
jgi:hypothetical protein